MAFTFSVLLLPSVVMAQGTVGEECNCWCGDSAEGAVRLGELDRGMCEDTCEAQEQEFLICTNDANLEPGASLKCWQQTECEDKDGRWDPDQAPDCKKGYHYCYMQPTAIPLSVAIGREGEVTSVESLGEYVNAFYEWAFYAALIIAVVMIMIGGLQYMVGKGVGDVQKAKSRISNAIIGVVILLGAYTILATVNPALINLEMPSIPKIKTVLYVDENSWCDSLLDAGYQLEFNNQQLTKGAIHGGECGDKATVVTGPSGAETTIEECPFRDCSGGKTCLQPNDQNDSPACFSCDEIGAGSNNPDAPTAAPEICSQIGYQKTGQNEHTYCFFSKDVGLVSPETITEGTCAKATIKCGGTNITACRQYDHVEITSSAGKGLLECINGPNEGAPSIRGEPSVFQKICSEDYCEVAPSNQTCVPYVTQGSHEYFGDPASPEEWIAAVSAGAAVGMVVPFVGGLGGAIIAGIKVEDRAIQWDCVNSDYIGEDLFGDPIPACLDKDGIPIKVIGVDGKCADGKECYDAWN